MGRVAAQNKFNRGEWIEKDFHKSMGDFLEFRFEIDDEEGQLKCESVLIPKMFLLNKRVDQATGKKKLLIAHACRNLGKLKALLSKEVQRLEKSVASV